MDAIAV